MAGDRLPDGIEIVERGTKFQSCQREVVGLGEADSVFAVYAKVRQDHEINAQNAEDAADGGCGLASGVEVIEKLPRRTTRGGSRGVGARPQTKVSADTLCVRIIQASQQQCGQQQNCSNREFGQETLLVENLCLLERNLDRSNAPTNRA